MSGTLSAIAMLTNGDGDADAQAQADADADATPPSIQRVHFTLSLHEARDWATLCRIRPGRRVIFYITTGYSYGGSQGPMFHLVMDTDQRNGSSVTTTIAAVTDLPTNAVSHTAGMLMNGIRRIGRIIVRRIRRLLNI